MSFKELKVYQKAYELAMEIFHLGKVRIEGDIKSQIAGRAILDIETDFPG